MIAVIEQLEAQHRKAEAVILRQAVRKARCRGAVGTDRRKLVRYAAPKPREGFVLGLQFVQDGCNFRTALSCPFLAADVDQVADQLIGFFGIGFRSHRLLL